MRSSRRWLSWLWTWVAPLVLPWVILLAVNAWPPGVPLARGAIPREGVRADRCTWACHNRGCAHRPALPAALTGDRALFGKTIDGLYRVGSLLSSDRRRGYGLANLLVFCVLWPALMYALWVSAWRERERLVALRRALESSSGSAEGRA